MTLRSSRGYDSLVTDVKGDIVAVHFDTLCPAVVSTANTFVRSTNPWRAQCARACRRYARSGGVRSALSWRLDAVTTSLRIGTTREGSGLSGRARLRRVASHYRHGLRRRQTRGRAQYHVEPMSSTNCFSGTSSAMTPHEPHLSPDAKST